jgi:hypothetical protein
MKNLALPNSSSKNGSLLKVLFAAKDGVLETQKFLIDEAHFERFFVQNGLRLLKPLASGSL